ncbi:MAG: hypothetical protein WKF73_00090 [Nocardioidaceae bacterium]
MELGDIAILVPARTSLPFLEDALDTAKIPYRAESSSLVYQASEVRDLLAAARVVADPSDLLASVTALRSPLFGCGDDDLWSWKRAGGSFNILAPVRDELADHPVGRGVAYLKALHDESAWMTPSEVLEAVVADRRMLEVAALGRGRARSGGDCVSSSTRRGPGRRPSTAGCGRTSPGRRGRARRPRGSPRLCCRRPTSTRCG